MNRLILEMFVVLKKNSDCGKFFLFKHRIEKFKKKKKKV